MNEVAEALMVAMLFLGLALGFTFLFAVFRDLRR
jgi:TRAP-type C4-dicarboxylate transport system permease small subunit